MTPTTSYPLRTSVAVEYTADGVRIVKTFSDPYAARRFYATKFRSGASPRIVRAERIG